ncbi:MAG: hypothetical protein PVJ42_03850 [bacterium]|jgi:hypothetical protein
MEEPAPGAEAEHPFDDRFTEEDDELVEKVARKMVNMRLTVPAIFLLESSKPLAFLGGQLLVFLEPFIQTLFNFKQYQRFAFLMENRDNWERLLRKIEDLEEEAKQREKEEKREKKKKKSE